MKESAIKETILIDGMSCGGCVAGVQKALGKLPLDQYEVEIGKATVDYDETKVTREEIIEAIEEAGFDVPDNQG